MEKQGILYIVAIHIGNLKDITLRAIDILKTVNGIICEEKRQGSTLLTKLDIIGHELITLNEHNEKLQVPIIIKRLLNKESFALISDCGTPVFADPGYLLINQAVTMSIPVTPIPGPSSLTAALSILDFKLVNFYFRGFLPRNNDQRLSELSRLRNTSEPIILMDAPYRLKALLEDIIRVFGRYKKITLACDLTLAEEKIYRGHVEEIFHKIDNKKAEFILIIHD